MTITIDEFKTGMRRLSAGVCLITTQDSFGKRSGLTATAVCSVSAEPPTLLVCVNRKNASYAAIKEAGVFAVNVLAFDDKHLADRFASPIAPEEKFGEGLWQTLKTTAPVLESALVGFDCRVSLAIEAGTHDILMGEIQAVKVRETEVKPLLFAHGGYGGFSAQNAPPMKELIWMPTWPSLADGW
jgi:flavin reductase (DIM6/NTAB) family NADH-FMN oxidoreductase RutF